MGYYSDIFSSLRSCWYAILLTILWYSEVRCVRRPFLKQSIISKTKSCVIDTTMTSLKKKYCGITMQKIWTRIFHHSVGSFYVKLKP